MGSTDIREPILETLSLLRAQFEQTRTTVHRDLSASGLFVAVDPIQIKQLFLNLCLNAVEAMGHGGQLEIKSGSKQAHGQWWVHLTVLGHGARSTRCDSGQDLRAVLFDKGPRFWSRTCHLPEYHRRTSGNHCRPAGRTWGRHIRGRNLSRSELSAWGSA